MNRLPLEIYVEIGGFLQGPGFDRPLLATISRQWQAAVERQTFSEIRVKSTDLDRFQDIVQNHRRRYVTKINYVVVLPAYDDDERCSFERKDDRQANNKVFTAAVHRLFSLLKSWDTHKDGYISLCFEDIYSPSDHPFLRSSSPSYDPLAIHFADRGDDDDELVDLWAWRFHYSYLRLRCASELPNVPVISSFSTRITTRNMSTRVPIHIVAKLPNLRKANLRLGEWDIRYLALRRMQRHNLAQALTVVFPRSSALEFLSLNMGEICFWAPTFSAGTLNLGDSTNDELGSAIRTATGGMANLKRLVVAGPIDATFLWPGPSHALREPYWQNLERLEVTFSARRPSGASYFRHNEQVPAPLETEMAPGYGDSEEDDAVAAEDFDPSEHRDIRFALPMTPDDDSLEPLIEAFGRACSQMPRLRSACLSTVLSASEAEVKSGRCMREQHQFVWGVWYFSPYVRPTDGYDHSDPAIFEDIYRRRLFWSVRDWRPNPALRSLLQTLGRERWGLDLVEKFFEVPQQDGSD
ncbi:hypothetical protein GGR55DRAFT_544680 [Xylaria sp. FL0064]|nr:hypothetical protein GGR55DRAFT_544680 [Xylaria sp. FL0064]